MAELATNVAIIRDTFTDEQSAVFENVISALENPVPGESKLRFIDGPGGTGKSYLNNVMLDYVRSKGHIALGVSSSGVASILLHDGKTAHSQKKTLKIVP
jgi:hypothetical protein